MANNQEKVYGVSRERLARLFDAGTFVELGAYTKRSAEKNEPASVVCGYGAVNGELVFAFAQDSAREKGAFGERHANKIVNLYSLALKNGAPVVGMFDSAGALVYDGAAALGAYGKVMKAVSDASGIIPQIALIDGVCGGSSAVIASMFDFAITVDGKSNFYVNSPFVIGGEAGKSGFAAACGMSAYGAENDAQAISFVKSLLALLPANNAQGALAQECDDANRVIDFDPENYEPSQLCAKLADCAGFVRVYEKYSKNLCAGFASIGGVVSCVIALKGCLDIASARVASKMISFCDSFSLPVVTLLDSEGLDVSLESESAAYASELARLASSYASASCAKIGVVIGKAYGAAFTMLASKSIGADITYATENACISVLSPEASVAFVWNDKVGEKSREELEAEWKEKCASADEAANAGEIDDVVENGELRKRICAALSMLALKSDSMPERKHTVNAL